MKNTYNIHCSGEFIIDENLEQIPKKYIERVLQLLKDTSGKWKRTEDFKYNDFRVLNENEIEVLDRSNLIKDESIFPEIKKDFEKISKISNLTIDEILSLELNCKYTLNFSTFYYYKKLLDNIEDHKDKICYSTMYTDRYHERVQTPYVVIYKGTPFVIKKDIITEELKVIKLQKELFSTDFRPISDNNKDITGFYKYSEKEVCRIFREESDFSKYGFNYYKGEWYSYNRERDSIYILRVDKKNLNNFNSFIIPNLKGYQKLLSPILFK